MALGRNNDVNVDDVNEEYNIIRCIDCKCEIVGKPWITIDCREDPPVHACGYSCSTRLKYYVGVGYWPRVINQEDFPLPRPVTTRKVIGGSADFGMDEIRQEIEEEEARIEMIEEYESDDSELYGEISP
jgi:hypothetical protein